MDLCKKYRPRRLKDVIGQDEAVARLGKLDDLPPCLLLTGPAGCGKTTLARILARSHGCKGEDLHEVNAATQRGIDDIRHIQATAPRTALYGERRVWILDEVHQLLGPAQSALLKTLEEPPNKSRFILCTTDPAKLLKTIRTRCTEVRLKPVQPGTLVPHLRQIWKDEEVETPLEDRVVERIAEAADGSVRQAVKLLEQCAPLRTARDMLAAVEVTAGSGEGIDIARELLSWPKPTWGKLSSLIKANAQEPETTRRIILGYLNAVLLGGGKAAGRAAQLIEIFQFSVIDSGKAGLSLMCYQACK